MYSGAPVRNRAGGDRLLKRMRKAQMKLEGLRGLNKGDVMINKYLNLTKEAIPFAE